MKLTIKHIIFLLLIVLLSLPTFQHAVKWFTVKPLDGDFILTDRPKYSWNSWLDGSFQNQFDRYIEDHIGFRPFFVRLNNQLDFNLFNKANAEGLLVGKNNMLYEYDYIRALTGEDFIGKATLDKKLLRFEFLRRHLKENLDIDLILILEPGKARTYPENIPDRYLEDGKSLSNYEYIAARATELDIPLLDLNHIFVNARDTAAFPLYPLYGTHWSEHTIPFVADTMISFMEKVRGIEMPNFFVKEVIISDTLNEMDYDGGKTLNLLFKLPHEPMPYPTYTFVDEPNKTRPMVLVVSDSYYWNIFNSLIPRNLFANEAFWYFNAKVYPDFYFGEKWTSDLDLQAEIEKQEIIILSVTERFLYKVDWGFIDQLYQLYTPGYSGDVVYKYENQLRINAGWFEDVLAKSKTDRLTLEEAIRKEAYYQAWVQEPETFLTWFGREHFQAVISNDQKWAASVREKAEAENVSFDAQLQKDADYIFEMDYPEIFHLNQKITKYREAIKSDPAWLEEVAAKARHFNMPLEEMIKVDAEFLARQEKTMSPDLEERIRFFEEQIKNDPDWLRKVLQKAIEQNKTPEEMIREDAIYMAEQEKR